MVDLFSIIGFWPMVSPLRGSSQIALKGSLMFLGLHLQQPAFATRLKIRELNFTAVLACASSLQPG
jgi:hypothetical protein